MKEAFEIIVGISICNGTSAVVTGDLPSMLTSIGSAPLSRRSLTAAVWPSLTAASNAVDPAMVTCPSY